jgi:urea transport system permease protein
VGMRFSSPIHLAICGLSLILLSTDCRADDAAYTAGLDGLKSSDFQARTAAVGQIAGSGAPRARATLSALHDGKLFIRKSTGTLVIVTDGTASDAPSGAALQGVEESDLKKIIINNQMRVTLRAAVARLSLQAPEVAVRRAAVESLLASLDDDTIVLLREQLPKESDASVRAMLETALALADLRSAEVAQRRAAIETLSNSMNPEARTQLAALLANGPDGAAREPDAELRALAQKAIERIDGKRSIYGLVETLFFGLSLGSVLVLAAIGLAITFGVMGVINMAHGELIMLGAYATWLVQEAMPNHLEWTLLVAVPVAFLVSAIAGIGIERGIVRFLYGRPLETLLATFGVSLVLQQAVRSIFSPLNRAVSTPQWMSGQLVINDALAINYNRLYIIVFSAAVFFALVALLRFTSLGLQVRAVSQNRAMARAMGVRAGWIDAMTFGLGSGVAGLAGVALSQLTNVGPNLGQSQIVDSFMVVVFGGVGNLWGTLVGGLSLGIANKLLEPYAGAVLAKILVLVFIILFIQRRPRGLFPQRGRAAEA